MLVLRLFQSLLQRQYTSPKHIILHSIKVALAGFRAWLVWAEAIEVSAWEVLSSAAVGLVEGSVHAPVYLIPLHIYLTLYRLQFNVSSS